MLPLFKMQPLETPLFFTGTKLYSLPRTDELIIGEVMKDYLRIKYFFVISVIFATVDLIIFTVKFIFYLVHLL